MNKRSLNTKLIVLAVLAVFVLTASLALAKDNKVKLTLSWKGIPLPACTLKIDNKKANTDITGTAEFNLDPGKYKVEVLIGGAKVATKNLNIKEGKAIYKVKL